MKTLSRWDREGKLTALREPASKYRVYKKSQLSLLLDENEIVAELEPNKV